jgi:transcriptional regulator with XRE-family HTH domain
MSKIDNILSLIDNSPEQIMLGIAARVKRQRLSEKLTQATLSQRAGIPLPTYRRFERSGDISLRALVRLAVALSETEGFTKLFSTQKYASIADILNENTERKRGERNGKN